MAELVAAIGVPHSPHYPSQYPKDGPENTSRTYRAVKEHLDAAKADRFVGMYVNDWTRSYGDRGREAVRRLLARGHACGVLPDLVTPEWVAEV